MSQGFTSGVPKVNDPTLAGNSQFLVPTEYAVKTYVDTEIAAITEAFPVDSIYISVSSTNPATTLGYGTWVQFGQGRVIVGQDSTDTDFDTSEETGGSKTHQIKCDEIPNCL